MDQVIMDAYLHLATDGSPKNSQQHPGQVKFDRKSRTPAHGPRQKNQSANQIVTTRKGNENYNINRIDRIYHNVTAGKSGFQIDQVK
jgi:hypothetical protein